jgi:hypothetical protein
MLFSLLYMVLRAVFRLAPAGNQRAREVEILVLRHQVKVLKRKAGLRGAFIPDSRCSSLILVDQAAESIDANDCRRVQILDHVPPDQYRGHR